MRLRAWVLVTLCLSLLTSGVGLSAQRQTKPLDPSTAVDLSLSLLRDNYDAWATEWARDLLLENVKSISPIESELAVLAGKESALSDDVSQKLRDLMQSTIVDQSSVRAGLLLASLSRGQERRDVLKKTLKAAQTVAPGARATLRVGLIYLAVLLADGEKVEAKKISEKLAEIADTAVHSNTSLSCVEKLLSGDVAFQLGEYLKASSSYKKADECLRNSDSVAFINKPILSVRQAWTAFRLADYDDVLSALALILYDSSAQSLLSDRAVQLDLAMMLGVALSEKSTTTPASLWMHAAAGNNWVSSGLALAIKYLNQKELYQLALSWSEILEDILQVSPVADIFYVEAIGAAERAGFLEKVVALKTRAVLALNSKQTFAKTTQFRPEEDKRRRQLLTQWANDVISARGQQSGVALGTKPLTELYRVAEVLSEEHGDLCSQGESFLMAHQVLASGRMDSLADKVFNWVKDCRNLKVKLRDAALVRVEMLRSTWKANVRDDTAWVRFRSEIDSAIAKDSQNPELRRLVLEAVDDSLERSRFADAEGLLQLLIVSSGSDGDSAQMERNGISNSLIRLISARPMSRKADSLAWVFLSRLARELSVIDGMRRQYELALASAIMRQSLMYRSEGRLSDSLKVLMTESEKFSIDSEIGRDLRFVAARTACSAQFEDECLTLAKKILASVVYSQHDRFLAAHWAGEVDWNKGRFFSAAKHWQEAGEAALQSERLELIAAAQKDVIRSGGVYSEIKQWPEALQTRELLLKLASKTREFSSVQSAFLDWSVQALVVGSYDIAARLSEDISEMSKQVFRNKKNQISSIAALSELVEKYSLLRVRGEPGHMLQKTVADFLKAARAFDAERFAGSRKQTKLAQIIVQEAFDYWQNSLLRDSDIFSKQGVAEKIENSIVNFRKSYADLLKGCEALDGVVFLKRKSAPCRKAVGENFVLYASRIREWAARTVGGEQNQLLRISSQVSLIESQARSNAGLKVNISGSFAAQLSPLLERNHLFLGGLASDSLKVSPALPGSQSW